MPRKSSGPWFWKLRNEWVVNIRGKRHYLGEDRDAAYDKWHELARSTPPLVESKTVWAVLDLFLDDVQKTKAPATYQWYKDRLQYFKDGVPNMPTSAIKPRHIREWLNSKEWSDTYKAGIVAAIKRSFKWAAEHDDELVSGNPLAGLKKPAAEHRELNVTVEDFAKILASVKDEPFRDLLTFIWLTGCRPQEASAIEAAYIRPEDQLIVFPVKKSKGKKKARVIHLTNEAFVVLMKWAAKNPKEPVFRNSRGNKWRANAFACRFKRLESKVGLRIRMYDLRHSYAHDSLTKGNVAPEIVATLLGHTDTRMLMKVYGHLLNAPEFMREQANKARTSVSPPRDKSGPAAE
jgi:integrase/recombinase XerD